VNRTLILVIAEHHERIAVHERSYKKYGYSTLEAHMPKAHQVYAQHSIEFVMESLKKIGSSAVGFAEHMMANRPFPQQAYRACYGLLRLGERYGDSRLEKACEKALVAGAIRYQQVELILKNKLEEVSHSLADTYNSPDHENIRGPDYFH